jgi:hypothetical protein
LETDAGKREDFVSLAQACVAINDDVRDQPAAGAQDDVFSNDAVRSYFAFRTDLGFWVNNGCGVDHG